MHSNLSCVCIQWVKTPRKAGICSGKILTKHYTINFKSITICVFCIYCGDGRCKFHMQPSLTHWESSMLILYYSGSEGF
jgi:hypothetical protein